MAPYSSLGDSFMWGSEGCRVNGLRVERSPEEILQQRKQCGGGNLRIWVLHVDHPFFSKGFFVTERGCYTAVNIRCVCICVCMCVCVAHQGSLMTFGPRLIMLSKDSELL